MATTPDLSGIQIEEADAFAGLRDLPDDAFQAAILDYPWKFDTSNGSDRFGHDRGTGESDLYTTATTARLGDVVLPELGRVVKPGGWVFLFADDDVYPDFRRLVEDEESVTRRRTLYWDSDSMGMGYYFRVQGYPVIPATVGDTDRYVQGRPNVIRARQTGVGADYHTQKPVDLYRDLLADPVLAPGESLLEPFGGTCPGAVVAQERDLDYLAFEVHPDALALARDRIAQTRL